MNVLGMYPLYYLNLQTKDSPKYRFHEHTHIYILTTEEDIIHPKQMV